MSRSNDGSVTKNAISTGHFLGIDVGTGSARAAVFDENGRSLGYGSEPIALWQESGDYYEQCTIDIWDAVCKATRSALKASGGEVRVAGIGICATCSLVLVGAAGEPVTVSQGGVPERDVMLWMDHRATREASEINATGAEVLRYVGGRVSVEMQIPKILWLKRNLPSSWSKARHFFDLPDFLTWRATGSLRRSMCSLVCKWNFRGQERSWDAGFLSHIGLGDLQSDGYARIGAHVADVGDTVGLLSRDAARELGLEPGIPVGASVIDAHAGGIGLLGARRAGSGDTAIDFNHRVALIGGTSSCHMAISPKAKFIPGVWGPYLSALAPRYWLSEGGQSATGALIDYVVRSGAGDIERDELTGRFALLNATLETAALVENKSVAMLTRDLHVFPDFHGNRSPRADASLLGMISGLSLSHKLLDQARLYLATIQSVAYGTRHIIETMNAHGFALDAVLACGGGTKNPLFLQQHADALGLPLLLGAEEEAGLLGCAMLGAVAAGQRTDVLSAMSAMSRVAREIKPAGGREKEYHNRKYLIFKRMFDDQMAYRSLMAGSHDPTALRPDEPRAE